MSVVNIRAAQIRQAEARRRLAAKAARRVDPLAAVQAMHQAAVRQQEAEMWAAYLGRTDELQVAA